MAGRACVVPAKSSPVAVNPLRERRVGIGREQLQDEAESQDRQRCQDANDAVVRHSFPSIHVVSTPLAAVVSRVALRLVVFVSRVEMDLDRGHLRIVMRDLAPHPLGDRVRVARRHLWCQFSRPIAVADEPLEPTIRRTG
jgi:hypothetical protein